MGEGLKSGLT